MAEKQNIFETYHYGVFVLLTAIIGATGTYYVTSYKVEQSTAQIEHIASDLYQMKIDQADVKARSEESARNYARLDDIARKQQQNYETLLTRLGQIDGKLDRALTK